MASARLLSADAHVQPLVQTPLASDTVLDGEPITALAELGQFAGLQIGVWELTAGTVTDVEVDEIFIVLSGSGTVHFADGSVLDLRPGVIAQLHAGDATTWHVTEAVRKIWFIPTR